MDDDLVIGTGGHFDIPRNSSNMHIIESESHYILACLQIPKVKTNYSCLPSAHCTESLKSD